MVDTLAIYVVNRYPTLASLYRSFEPMVVGLMLGGDNVCSRYQLSIFIEALMEGEAHNPCKLEEMADSQIQVSVQTCCFPPDLYPEIPGYG